MVPPEPGGELLMALITGGKVLIPHPIILPMNTHQSLKREGKLRKRVTWLSRERVYIHRVGKHFGISVAQAPGRVGYTTGADTSP